MCSSVRRTHYAETNRIKQHFLSSIKKKSNIVREQPPRMCKNNNPKMNSDSGIGQCLITNPECVQICSSFVNFHKEIVKIKQVVLTNRFPCSLIDKVICNFLNRQYTPHTRPKDKREYKPRIICCLPYFGNHSFRIRNYITKLDNVH